eukprot:gnl/MRDRNA2_/MRDRNA2_32906_c0_seq1.p1 gnl/MRDRNA2_/MRDRNA2_32906_c0~~gnl/MRDRNA2_/MRDRNA2_32906_c0_seq1.p1  ORF type:complete len:408 (-),score=67.75 gnl/MRDRNA2_/MRDRNA2_32906_c0_seq1:13-1236(-)
MSSGKKYDLLLFGATGFTGTLAAKYVTKQYGSSIHWAIAGRSQSKLDQLKQECQGLPDIVIADSSNQASIEAMVVKTKVVVTFAGPFARYGKGLVEACVKAGVDYCDITGESDFVREMIAKHDEAAQSSGARIVSFCGHDCIPWDLSVLMLAKKLKEKNPDNQLVKVQFWDKIKSQASGGTLETAFDIMFGPKKPKAPEVKALGYDPLLKQREETGPSEYKVSAQNVSMLQMANPKLGHSGIRTFFFMAGVNANAVKRSNALNKYGKKLTYCEGQAFSSLFKALKYLAGLAVFGLGLAIPPVRAALRKYVLPKPGEGPSEEFMNTGFLDVIGVATGSDGSTAKSTIRFPVDPGYKDTARMAVESGLALSLDGAKLADPRGGVLTPGCCQGEVLLERLRKTGSAFEYL